MYFHLLALYPPSPVSSQPCILPALYPPSPVSSQPCILPALYPPSPVSSRSCLLPALYPPNLPSYPSCPLVRNARRSIRHDIYHVVPMADVLGDFIGLILHRSPPFKLSVSATTRFSSIFYSDMLRCSRPLHVWRSVRVAVCCWGGAVGLLGVVLVKQFVLRRVMGLCRLGRLVLVRRFRVTYRAGC
jgi:hypothetical protein